MTSINNDRGYPLPDGDLTGDDIACMLLFYPDRDEYRRALWSSLDYLGTWLAWERDSQKRGRDAAAIWKDANDQTLECYDMACLDQLTADVAAIRALLTAFDPCCGQNTTINPPPAVETEIQPGVGDPPDYYGETALTDWADWEEHVCYNAHRWVDQLVANAGQMEGASATGAITLGLVAAGLALLSFTGIGIPISFAIAATVASGLSTASTGVFSTTADDLESARDDIVCALLNGGSVADIIESYLGSLSLDWLLLYSFVDYDSLTAIIYEGGANGEYLPAETDDSCDCVEPALIEWSFASDLEGWPSVGFVLAWLSAGLIEGNPNTATGWRFADGETGNQLLSRFSLSGTLITVTKMAVKFKFYTPTTPIGWSFKFGVVETGTDTLYESDTYTSAAEGTNVWVEKEYTFASPVTLRTSASAVNMSANRDASAAAGQRVHVEYIKLYGSTS